MKKMNKNRIKSYLQKIDDICAGYIFGSFASNMERPSSDIDIAILLYNGSLDFQCKNNIILDLNEITGREVDCVELNKVTPVLQMQIIKNGQQLFCKDEKHVNEFTIEVIRNYVDLKKIRKPIEDRMKQVSIYG
jgi:predicted nucleotidyltransferase|tara:strand:- start:645 stop:1046 length:402 start_codon:yes stop_codon:yes gene_type:complete